MDSNRISVVNRRQLCINGENMNKSEFILDNYFNISLFAAAASEQGSSPNPFLQLAG